MCLKPTPTGPIPDDTARVAKAAFPSGNTYMRLRDELGTIYEDEDFAHLFPRRGQPAYPPWRLALVTVMQYMENLSDRQAADAVRARIDWKYVLGLPLEDAGFNFSVLSEFRARFVEGESEELLLDKMLQRFREKDLLKARGKQRTDATHVLGKLRELNRLELLGETLRVALNELAGCAPEWVRSLAQPSWFERYGTRIEDRWLPDSKKARQTYGRLYGVDGFTVLDAAAERGDLSMLPRVQILRQVWNQHYEREEAGAVPSLKDRCGRPTQGKKHIESPHETEARFRNKSGTA